MSILFHVPDPPVTLGWHSIRDDTKWNDEPGAGRATNQWVGGEDDWSQTWEPAGEAPEDSSSRLVVVNTWATDFRTDTQVTSGEFRITMSEGVSGGFDPQLLSAITLDIGGNTINTVYGAGGGATSRVWTATNINLPDGNDVAFIHFTKDIGGENPTGTIYITNIEFYYDTSNMNPGGAWGTG